MTSTDKANAIREAALARLAARQAAQLPAQSAKSMGPENKLPIIYDPQHPDTLAMIAEQKLDREVKAAKQAEQRNDTSNFPLLNTSPFKEMLAAGGMTFNHEQLQALEMGLQGKDFCLIGAAGTGKTTVTQTLIKLLQVSENTRPLSERTKHLDKDAPGIVIVGFTNKAVNNIKKKLPAKLQKHCITIHKLIEFAPVYYEIPNPDNKAEMKKTMAFEPTRNSVNPLPHISTVIHEESSMIGTDLFRQEMDALPLAGRTQCIFLGDLNQLPPVFGPSILGFKLAQLPTVELVHVYRQALLSPIISLATAIRTNNSAAKMIRKPAPSWNDPSYDQSHLPWNLTEQQVIDRGEHGKVTLRPWKKRTHDDNAIHAMKTALPAMIDNGEYDIDNDMILIPFNKAFGTLEVNRIIGQHLAKKNDWTVHEVIARYQKSYWCEGDRVVVDRREAVIKKIEPTIGYYGKKPRNASKTMNRWGVDPEQPNEDINMTADDILNALDRLEMGDDKEDSKNLASHTITVYFPDSDTEERLNSAGMINNMIFGWALTVHKSQGSEWPKVFIFLHNSHAKGTLMSRELLYTAITRAKQELYIICEGDIGGHTNSLSRGAEKPVIPGTTLKEKIAYFSAKLKEQPDIA